MFIFDEELGLLFDRVKGHGHRSWRRCARAASYSSSRSTRPNCRPASSPHGCAGVASMRTGIKTVVIDSLNGYQAAMPEENSLILHMHELLQYLNRQGATTFLTVAQHGLVGDMKAPVDVTYLADTVILLRYFEALGTVRRAISVIKKRTGRTRTRSASFASTDAGLTLGRAADGFPGRAARCTDACRRKAATAGAFKRGRKPFLTEMPSASFTPHTVAMRRLRHPS